MNIRLLFENLLKIREVYYKKQYHGTCKKNSVYENSTEMEEDLGYWAASSKSRDPDDSNFEEIDFKKFSRECNIPTDVMDVMINEIGTFLKRYDDSIYCFYSDEYDTWYFWA